MLPFCFFYLFIYIFYSVFFLFPPSLIGLFLLIFEFFKIGNVTVLLILFIYFYFLFSFLDLFLLIFEFFKTRMSFQVYFLLLEFSHFLKHFLYL